MHLQSLLLGAIALSNLVRGSPIPSDRIQSDNPQKRDGPADCPDSEESLVVLARNVLASIWDQRPSRYDMSNSLRGNDDYKELAAVAHAIINVKPDWIPETIFQSSTKYFQSGESATSDEYKPFIHVEVSDQKKAHVPVLKLFANKDPIYLADFTFEIARDGSEVVWHQALKAALDTDIVKERLKTLNVRYAGPFADDDSKMYKVMAIIHALTGDTPEGLWRQNYLWSKDGGEYDSTFDPLSYSPTILYTADKKLRPILRSKDDLYSLQDCRVFAADDRATPVEMDDQLLDLSLLLDQTFWAVRLPFQKPAANADRSLLKVSPPDFDTEPYFSARPS